MCRCGVVTGFAARAQAGMRPLCQYARLCPKKHRLARFEVESTQSQDAAAPGGVSGSRRRAALKHAAQDGRDGKAATAVDEWLPVRAAGDKGILTGELYLAG
ncbi:hypothetical protein EJ04DRAFT_138805 [Polyplosphaeria fusca]|uniref:Uncharacterized protein n=1 Tax=Polyplosphaeria fusca TaxID=682080 RepID=A0A9P4QZX8_9PLEO|nr:hypothetical protein EJ04DRAFT_138805 [Polyplosphaeria fusca]